MSEGGSAEATGPTGRRRAPSTSALAAPMRFSVRVNNDLTLPEYVALARAAEGAGFDQLWVSDDLFFRSASIILA